MYLLAANSIVVHKIDVGRSVEIDIHVHVVYSVPILILIGRTCIFMSCISQSLYQMFSAILHVLYMYIKLDNIALVGQVFACKHTLY